MQIKNVHRLLFFCILKNARKIVSQEKDCLTERMTIMPKAMGRKVKSSRRKPVLPLEKQQNTNAVS